MAGGMSGAGRDLAGAEIAGWVAALPGAARLPFLAAPTSLYRVAELYAGFDPRGPLTAGQTWDARVYAWTRDPGQPHLRALSPAEAIATRLHDAAMDRLVAEHLSPATRTTVGFMGGHGIPRDAPIYEQVARIARELRQQGLDIVTGGGPGLMEAANFGAFMAPYDERDFVDALALLRTVPAYDGDTPARPERKAAWAVTAAQVRAGLLGKWDAEEEPGSENLGIPTWYYGDEPPNLFATRSGKYFANSLREDGLVSVANGGLFFGRGDAGTVQEVFQNANYNYYRDADTRATPMVFFDRGVWDPARHEAITHAKPVFQLVDALAREAPRPFPDVLLLTDDPARVAEFFLAHNADRPESAPRMADKKLASHCAPPSEARPG